ncbi:MAG: hypothetical protein ABI977_34800 [Acidobacteriota bacterium]
MSVTITIPTELQQKIAGRAAAQGKEFEQVAIEVLAMSFEQLDDYETTLLSLQQARQGKTKPFREFLEELRQEFGLPEKP